MPWTAPHPYLGMGYTAWWARSGLSLSADLGLLAQGLHPATGPKAAICSIACS
jgi:hypothetical protein